MRESEREVHLSFSLSSWMRGGGRWEKLKSERSCAKLRFDFVLAVGKEKRGGRRDRYNVVEKFEFSSRRYYLSRFFSDGVQHGGRKGGRDIFMAHML